MFYSQRPIKGKHMFCTSIVCLQKNIVCIWAIFNICSYLCCLCAPPNITTNQAKYLLISLNESVSPNNSSNHMGVATNRPFWLEVWGYTLEPNRFSFCIAMMIKMIICSKWSRVSPSQDRRTSHQQLVLHSHCLRRGKLRTSPKEFGLEEVGMKRQDCIFVLSSLHQGAEPECSWQSSCCS